MSPSDGWGGCGAFGVIATGTGCSTGRAVGGDGCATTGVAGVVIAAVRWTTGLAGVVIGAGCRTTGLAGVVIGAGCRTTGLAGVVIGDGC